MGRSGLSWACWMTVGCGQYGVLSRCNIPPWALTRVMPAARRLSSFLWSVRGKGVPRSGSMLKLEPGEYDTEGSIPSLRYRASAVDSRGSISVWKIVPATPSCPGYFG